MHLKLPYPCTYFHNFSTFDQGISDLPRLLAARRLSTQPKQCSERFLLLRKLKQNGRETRRQHGCCVDKTRCLPEPRRLEWASLRASLFDPLPSPFASRTVNLPSLSGLLSLVTPHPLSLPVPPSLADFPFFKWDFESKNYSPPSSSCSLELSPPPLRVSGLESAPW